MGCARQQSLNFEGTQGHTPVPPLPGAEAEGRKPLPLLRRAAGSGARTATPRGRTQTREHLEAQLGTILRDSVSITITDNRHTMVSSRREVSGFELRLHHMFLEADDRTIRALGRYLTRGDRRASARLDAFIEANGHRIRRNVAPPRALRARGEHHDLRELFDELNERWFGGLVRAHVTWGRRSARRRGKRSIRLGTYVDEDRLVRIHPVLDAPWVPRFFVAYVLFHEMLHAVVPAPVRNGRQCFHGPQFRSLERAYPDYRRALEWERKNLHRLLTT